MWSILLGLAWGCPEEGLGNDIETAIVLSVGSTNASLCSAQARWYRIMAGDGILDLTAIFAHAQGDLDLFLYDQASLDTGLLPLASSRTATDNERIVLDRTGLGDLYLKLQWHPLEDIGDFELRSYGLSLSFSDSMCDHSIGRSFANPEQVAMGEENVYALCPGRELWFSFSLFHSSTFLAQMTSQEEDSRLQMVLWSEAGMILDLTHEDRQELSYSYWGMLEDPESEALDTGQSSDTSQPQGTSETDSDLQEGGTSFFVQIRALEELSEQVPLSFVVQDNSLSACVEDDYPQAVFMEQAPDLTWGSYVLRACATDYFWFENNENSQLWIRAEFETAEGDLDLYLYDESGVLVASSESYEGIEEIVIAQQGRFLLKVQLSHDLQNIGIDYTLSALSQEVDDTEGQGATISVEEEADPKVSSPQDTGCMNLRGAYRASLRMIVFVAMVIMCRRRFF